MSVRFSSDIEQEELQARKTARGNVSWDFYRSTSLVEVVHKARELGWGEKKVQVRQEQVGSDVLEYTIEPYERDCGCSGILKFADFFLRPDED